MSAFTEIICREKLQEYMNAETAVLSGQSYKIGSRALTRADLQWIQEGITLWSKRLEALGGSIEPGHTTNSGGIVVKRVIFRDL